MSTYNPGPSVCKQSGSDVTPRGTRSPIRSILWRTALPVILAISSIALGVTAVVASPASASTSVAPEILGANWLSGHGVNVCYPVGTPCAGTTAYAAEGTDNWQCEELQRVFGPRWAGTRAVGLNTPTNCTEASRHPR